MYCRIYLEALDLLIQCIKTHFNQPGYQAYCCLQNLLMKAVSKKDYSSELSEVLHIYGDDFNEQALQVQLHILGSTIPDDISNAIEVFSYLKKMPEPKKKINK